MDLNPYENNRMSVVTSEEKKAVVVMYVFVFEYDNKT